MLFSMEIGLIINFIPTIDTFLINKYNHKTSAVPLSYIKLSIPLDPSDTRVRMKPACHKYFGYLKFYNRRHSNHTRHLNLTQHELYSTKKVHHKIQIQATNNKIKYYLFSVHNKF